ncbi:putative nuclease HARBI1 isoform X1 [Eurosta solidaginis]|uniref:putative nuclease HARBI1 isoform X1 n=1 Tax=Eurosta solidaginis TaxID=178769 RepID=UPI0035307F00
MELPQKQFQTKYRLTKEIFMEILREINLREGVRSTYIPPILRLAATLEILAGGGYQWQTGGAPMGHSTLSKVFRSTLVSMDEHLCSKWILFEKRFQPCKEWFNQKYNFPGVVGAVDGTQLQLLRPVENEHIYFNRKGKHSINAMIVSIYICDHKLIIKAICPQYGGAAHDSFVWKASKERLVMERQYNSGNRNSWLLGDSGYPLEPWLMTPYRLREDEPDERKSFFNDTHSKARSIVERTIGVYKGRRRILSDDRKPKAEIFLFVPTMKL